MREIRGSPHNNVQIGKTNRNNADLKNCGDSLLSFPLPSYIMRVLLTVGVQSVVLLHLIAFALSLMAFYPYVKDLFCMSRFVVCRLQSKFYKANNDLILTFIALHLHEYCYGKPNISILTKSPFILSN
uniref:Transmembrane protein n=1 Tax=Angiostrongylus cantonensis TaxID=6313 RepID=A0A0K0D3M9_ANGCA